ncbi:hypothetical protein BJ508DRAFT_333850 [Ascobolus immersus RN42]|uniref:Uncharacterized protein n=1 Tax=Ascobolus immersus RN42 TaxID=1160509 RepID=A0A3N4HLF1_ASCIM|nr:hypothetical protein BJ508DRAFT_333850 [Ascobolus immersus RN42]
MPPKQKTVSVAQLSLKTRIRRVRSLQQQYVLQHRTSMLRMKMVSEQQSHRLHKEHVFDEEKYPKPPNFETVTLTADTIDWAEKQIADLESKLKKQRDMTAVFEIFEDAIASEGGVEKAMADGTKEREEMGWTNEDIDGMLKSKGLEIGWLYDMVKEFEEEDKQKSGQVGFE